MAAVLLSCAVGAGCSSVEGEPVGSSAQAITFGATDAGDEAVVALAHFDPCAATPTIYCTGTLIAPRVVVTAAHCVELPTELLQVFFGGDTAGAGTWIRAAAREGHPDFDGSTFLNDIGLVLLEADAPASPVAMRQSPLDASMVGMTARIVGFGVPEPGGGEIGVKRTGTSELSAVDPTRFTTLPAPSMSCQVDSGGPVFMTFDGAEVLAGITSSGDPLCTEYAHNTRVDAFLASYVQPLIDGAGGAGGAAPPLPSGGCAAVPPCTVTGCPSGEQCNEQSGECEPAPPPPADPGPQDEEGGCLVARGRPEPLGAFWLGGLFVLLAARRRLR